MTIHAYVGAFTTPDRKGRGDGLHAYAIEAPLGPWRHLQHLGGLENPSFLIANRAGTRLYVVHGGRSRASALARSADGTLSMIGTVEVEGLNPVDLALDPAERTLVVACYGSGTVSVLPVDATGGLGACRQRIALRGPPGPDTREQAGPHPHGVTFDPSGRFVLVPDKGTDRVFVFAHQAGGLLAPAPAPFLQLPPGCGPRHLAFHPNGEVALIVNELSCSVMAARWDRESGTLRAGQIVSTLPPGAAPGCFAAEVAISPDGKSAYASNRVDDSIAVFDIAGREPPLRLRQMHPSGGRTPRAFVVVPDGTALYVANQESDALVVLARDPHTGEVSDAGRTVLAGSPVAIVLVPAG